MGKLLNRCSPDKARILFFSERGKGKIPTETTGIGREATEMAWRLKNPTDLDEIRREAMLLQVRLRPECISIR